MVESVDQKTFRRILSVAKEEGYSVESIEITQHSSIKVDYRSPNTYEDTNWSIKLEVYGTNSFGKRRFWYINERAGRLDQAVEKTVASIRHFFATT